MEPTFAVGDAIAAAATAHGGTMIFGPSAIPTVGTLIRFLDPAGNDIGAMADETPRRT